MSLSSGPFFTLPHFGSRGGESAFPRRRSGFRFTDWRLFGPNVARVNGRIDTWKRGVASLSEARVATSEYDQGPPHPHPPTHVTWTPLITRVAFLINMQILIS